MPPAAFSWTIGMNLFYARARILLLRHWTISDLCSDGVLEEDQLFKIIPATLPSDLEPLEPLRNLDTPRPNILPSSVGAAGMLH